MTKIAGPFSGMKVVDARNSVIEYLENNDKISQIVEKEQEVPVSERGKNPVEIILLKEWYVRQTHIQDRIRELSEEIEFHPPRNKQFLLDWMENISIDWPISRRRWYHTEIPIWYAYKGSKVICAPQGSTFNHGVNLLLRKARSSTVKLEKSWEYSEIWKELEILLEKRRFSTLGWIQVILISSYLVI